MRRFNVIEAFNGFHFVDANTGQTAHLGDGTDRESRHEIGSLKFVDEWEQDLNQDINETLSVYFPEQWDKEVIRA